MDDMVERVSEAIVRAACPGREGPFGGYDYGHENADPPKGGRYVIRDFRDLSSPECGAWLHQTDDRDLHEAMFDQMTKHHIARAAIEAMREPLPEMLKSGARLSAHKHDVFCVLNAGAIWKAMIDAALPASLTHPHPPLQE